MVPALRADALRAHVRVLLDGACGCALHPSTASVALATQVLAAAYRPHAGPDALAAAREYNRFEVARVVAEITAEGDPRGADPERVSRGDAERDGGAVGGENGSLGRTYTRWSAAEEAYFLTLCEKHGVGKWAQILAEGQKAGKLRADLTSVHLKDKYRNLKTDRPTRRPSRT